MLISITAFAGGLNRPQMIERTAPAALDLDIVGDDALSSLE
nr:MULTISPECIES: hypothetical protein [unclassified Roseibium]